ncbi:MAG: DMT family transporter [Tissierellia bacterium]|nr:DMT family transporter [Tissierellia bacterium]
MSEKMKGNLLLLLTAMIWGASFVAQVSGMDHVGPFAFNFARNVVATLFLYVVLKLWPLITGKEMEEETPEMKRPTLIGGILVGIVLGIAMTFQQIGVIYTTAGKAGFITALYIILVPLFGIFIGQKIKGRVWIAVLLAVAGLYLLSVTEGFVIGRGDSFVILCAFAYTFHILVVDHFSPKAHGVKLSMIQFAVAGLVSLILMVAFRENFSMEALINAAPPILYAGVLSSGVGFTLQIIAQKKTDPTMASMIMSLESVFAVIAGAILLGEVLSPREVMGCILMFVAIILAQLPDKRERSLE